MHYMTMGIIAGVIILIYLALKGLHWAKMILIGSLLAAAVYYSYKFFF